MTQNPRIHAKRQTYHASKRAFERYGMYLPFGLLQKMADWIKTGKAEFIDREEYGPRTFWAVSFQGQWLYAVFDPETERIATFLPAEDIKVQTWLKWKNIYGLTKEKSSL